MVDAQRLVAATARLARLAKEDFSIATMLRTLAQAATECLDIDGAGVMRRVHDQNVFEHSHGAYAMGVETLEKFQEALQEGPCAEAIETESTIIAEDLVADDRWQGFRELAAESQVASMIAIPLISRGRGWGVLDLYRAEPGPWSAEESQAAQVLADLAVAYMVMASDRNDAREAQEHLAHRATHDGLTGLPNRALLFDRLEHALANAERSGAGVAAVFLDLDRFKEINDTFGHLAADAALIEFGRRLAATLREGDTLARFAGDEFVIVCEGLPQDGAQALHDRVASLAKRLQRTMQEPIQVGEDAILVSASIGAAITTERLTAQELVANADSAMYSAKQSGPGSVSVRDRIPAGTIAGAHRLERALVGALDRGELQVFYQPIVQADTGTVVAVEALLRWDRPDHGLLTAGAFVDIAVKTGMIVQMGRWAITQACEQMAAWQRELPDIAPSTVYINLSTRELADDGLLDVIAGALATTGLSPHHVGFEVIEEDLADLTLVSRLHELQRAGHPLSVDDFGTGYSSLSRLLDLPATVAKLDGSAVHGIPGDARRVRFVDGVLRVAETLDLQVIAEGVETPEQAEHLSKLGCPLLQGYYFARPQSADGLTAIWAEA